MKLYISSSYSSKKYLTDILLELIELRFKSIELTGNIKYSEHIIELLLKFKEENDLDLILHNYFPFQREEFVLNLASRDPEIKLKTVKQIKYSIDLSKRLGKSIYSLHPGFKNDLLPKLRDLFFIKANNKFNRKKDFYQTLNSILDQEIDSDFKIAVENLHPKNSFEVYSFLCTPDDIDSFLIYFNEISNVGILLDMGHLNIAANMLNFGRCKMLDNLFGKYYKKIFEIHISENDGTKDSHNISQVNSWQIEYLQGCKKYLKDVPLVLEWHNCASGEAFKRYEIIRNRLEE